VLISAEAVPYRPHRGVYVTVDAVVDPEGAAEAHRRFHAEYVPAVLEIDGVVGAWTFGTSARYRAHPWDPGNRRVTVYWLDDEPLDVAAAIAPLEQIRSGEQTAVTTEFAGPLETIYPYEWDWFDEAGPP
jgi:hypothetical protein